MNKTNKKLLNLLIVFGAVSLIEAVLLTLKNNVEVCEFFATTVGRGWIWFSGHISSALPFSLFELFVGIDVVASVGVLVAIVVMLCKRKPKISLVIFSWAAVVALCCVTLYTATATMSYNREQLSLSTYDHETADVKIDADSAMSLANVYAAKLQTVAASVERNQNGTVKMPSVETLNEVLEQEFSKLDDYFSPYTPKVKKIACVGIMSQLNTVGVFFSLTGTVSINSACENFFDLPLTMAHELAHSKGVMREADANTVAYYVALKSDNVYLQYAVLLREFYEMQRIVRLFDNDEFSLSSLIDEKTLRLVNNDFAYYSNYWANYTLLSDIGTMFNDIYLKLSGQSGVDSYHEDSETKTEIEIGEGGEEIVTTKVVRFSNLQNVLIYQYLAGNFVV